jgi:hypothetical protein
MKNLKKLTTEMLRQLPEAEADRREGGTENG